ncbi:putative urea ABC transporter substrate-binding protein [Sulfuricurvum kujiense]|uniref:putative urea ABC transporter substrate-binding protein n=1 Tax=Sulfuricurvum kujiense TaxID=148813 RepID=UPI00030F9186|nr:putative urea ABC transporter substrate-binding protein [Sulfuricurvum kujiense]
MKHSLTQCTSAAGSSKLTSPKLSTRISLAVLALAVASTTMFAAPKTNFKVAWTIYAGWMPWDYGARKGIVKKWADKYGIKIDVVQLNDYVESINQYSAGSFDGCVMTNMDALTIPAAGGVDSTAVIIGDYSNGNDGIVSKSANSMKDLKGQKINLVEYSVSHYLLERGLASAGLKAKDVKTINTSDADIVSAFNSPSMKNVVTWNPQLGEVKKVKNAKLLFDSSKIPGEIIDMMVVNTQTLKENPKLGKALTGAWFEIMGIMSKNDAKGIEARTLMAKASGASLKEYQAQLATTKMLYGRRSCEIYRRSKTDHNHGRSEQVFVCTRIIGRQS